MIETQFVTVGGTAPLMIMPRATCKPSEMSVLALSTAHLDRLHRFIRLWRRLGWTVHELDLAIQAFGGELTSQTLIALADTEAPEGADASSRGHARRAQSIDSRLGRG